MNNGRSLKKMPLFKYGKVGRACLSKICGGCLFHARRSAAFLVYCGRAWRTYKPQYVKGREGFSPNSAPPTTSPRTALSLASKSLLYDSLSCYLAQCAVLPLSDYLLRRFRWSLRRRVPQIFLPAPPCPLCRIRVRQLFIA